MEYYNNLIDPSTFDCQVNAETNAFELRRVLRDPYKFSPESMIEFSIMDIIMPSSARPTGTYQIDFYSMIGDEYMLVDTVQVFDKLRGIPGELYNMDVIPTRNQTYEEDIFDFNFNVAHEILKGGFIEIVIPEQYGDQLVFTEQARCVEFSEGFSDDTKCSFDIESNLLNITDAFTEEPYTLLDKKIRIKVDGIFTQRSVKPTSAFSFRTFDAHRFEIDTHRTYKLGPMNSALDVELV